jgi:SHS2 domain-containing protein
MPHLPFEEIEHTADWAIRVRGKDLAELFATAARGMFSLITDLSQVETRREFELDLRAADVETLLVDWLNELLFLCEDKDLVFTEFQVEPVDEPQQHQLPVARLRATIRGGNVSERVKCIKAATFSSLAIQQRDGGYETELVFDV